MAGVSVSVHRSWGTVAREPKPLWRHASGSAPAFVGGFGAGAVTWHVSKAMRQAMDSGNSPYLPAQVAESLAASCSGGELSAPSKSSRTVRRSSKRGNATDPSNLSLSGTTSEHSTALLGVDTSTSSPEGSLARTSAALDVAPESKARGLDCGEIWRELSAKFDRGSCSWKTHRCLFPEVLPWSLVTLPRWGMMRDGAVFERQTSGRHTREIACLLLPTPKKAWGRHGVDVSMAGERHSAGVTEMARVITREFGWRWPPRMVESLMMWPIGWTDLRPLGTAKFHQWSRSHGGP